MAAAGIKEKISGFLNKIKSLLSVIKEGFKAILALMASLFNGIKTKSRKTKKKPVVNNIKKKAPAAEPSEEEQFTAGKIRTTVNAKIDYLTGRFLGHFPEGKRRPMLFAFGGLCALLLILVISAVAVNSGKTGKTVLPDKIAGIPQEEIFFPAEPDFLPKYILEREPRRFWASEDIRSFWKSPTDAAFWQKEIKSTVDKLMEGVP